ncbi:unnamed protein product [Vicia faba]|uniref:Reverse transcriptase zinc-binding domain-containing protein n=1 Tax=Vicia faba TaxID=3906 RepID=A0AAV1A623_VICFA|nr:unnamed protein product [Vicia faba]
MNSRIITLKLASAESIASNGCKMIIGDLESEHWAETVWARSNIPKHSFMYWMAIQDRLKTRSMLKKMGILDTEDCLLCGMHEENIRHLFFDCVYSRKCLEQVKNWLGWQANINNLPSASRWINRAKITRFKKIIYAALLAGLVYNIWRCGNEVLWYQKLEKPEISIVNCCYQTCFGGIKCRWHVF